MLEIIEIYPKELDLEHLARGFRARVRACARIGTSLDFSGPNASNSRIDSSSP